MNDSSVDAVIVGAGISGLTLAYLLKRMGKKVAVVEKEKRPGGVISTISQSGFLIETGPNSILLTHPFLQELVRDLGMEDEIVFASSKANNRYILKNGNLEALPLGPLSFLKTPLFSWSAKARLALEPFIPTFSGTSDESLAAFVERRLGREFLDYAINPFVAGVYAGRPESLSLKSALPKLYQLEKDYGSLIGGSLLGRMKRRRRKEKAKSLSKIFSFRQGLDSLISGLSKKLSENLLLETSMDSFVQKDGKYVTQAAQNGVLRQLSSPNIIFTAPVHGYSKIPFPSSLLPPPELSQVYYCPVSLVYVGYSENPSSRYSLDGFGFLIPEKENRKILGALWNSSLFENRAPKGGVGMTVFVGGSRSPHLALLPPKELEAMVCEELQDILKTTRKPDFIWMKTWEKAIPQYNLGYEKIREKIREYEKSHPGLYLRGNFYGGISVPDCILSSFRLALALCGKKVTV